MSTDRPARAEGIARALAEIDPLDLKSTEVDLLDEYADLAADAERRLARDDALAFETVQRAVSEAFAVLTETEVSTSTLADIARRIADEDDTHAWFATRCVVSLDRGDERLYEERITLWQARDADHAIALGEREAAKYAEDVGGTRCGVVQCFSLFDRPGHGAEVFSLMRRSALDADAYVDRFFDTGAERETEAP